MRVPLKWLNEYVSLAAYKPAEISQILTSLGIEVESVSTYKPYNGPVVVGQIVTAVKHPDADQLQICQVEFGGAKPVQVVCGAKNARAGLKVAFARPGAELPNGIKINVGKIRGVASEGMLCSETELGLGSGDEGIIELDAKATLGVDVADLLKATDSVFEVSLTPNRADCLGIIGIARDLAAKISGSLQEPPYKPTTTPSVKSSAITVKVDKPETCARFTALSIKGVRPVASPSWLQQRLRAAGQRPINLIVDVSNYVMLEYSQPIHTYDVRHIEGGIIQVRHAKSGEKLKTLDGSERLLRADDIVICDKKGPIGLAGIMGGENSEVADDTSDLVVEVACFDARQVRRTAKHFGLHTEASHRFERGVNIDNIDRVNWRVAYLIQKCLEEVGQPAPQVAADIVDSYPHKSKPKPLALRMSRLRKMLSLPTLSAENVGNDLQRLGLKLLDSSADRLLFEIPAWRLDLEREVDLIEEVARLIGYDRIPSNMPYLDIEPKYENPLVQFVENARTGMAQCNMHEVITYSFIAEADVTRLLISPKHELDAKIKLANPLSDDWQIMQTTLAANLLKAVINNRRRGFKSNRLFEIGRIYFTDVSSDKDFFKRYASDKPRHFTDKASGEKRPIERQVIAGILDHPKVAKSWQTEESELTFFDGKAVVSDWFKCLGLESYLKFSPLPVGIAPYLNPTASALIICHGQIVGVLGEIHPQAGKNFGFSVQECPVYFEIDLQDVLKSAETRHKYVSSLSKFPASLRDLSMVVGANITHHAVLESLKTFPDKKYLKDFRLFDIYTGSPIQQGFKSLSYSASFQSADKTLNDKEVDQEMEKLLAWLKRSVGAELRV